MFSPPCGTWSRANWANKAGPQPCRNFKFPWGIPGQLAQQPRRATSGNKFIHFSLRAIAAAESAMARLQISLRTLLEHPEDFGRVRNGRPASIWQLPETRKAFRPDSFSTVPSHQCQYGVDRKKQTRLLVVLPNLASFGYKGWPIFDLAGKYLAPLLSVADTDTSNA